MSISNNFAEATKDVNTDYILHNYPAVGMGGHGESVEPFSEVVQNDVENSNSISRGNDKYILSKEKNILSRMFSAFDVTQRGYVDEKTIEGMCKFLGRDLTAEDMQQMKQEINAIGGNMTFEQLWTWWCANRERAITKNCFSLISAHFSMPYHQQQLFTKEEGEMYTESYRVLYFFRDMETGEERQVSPWHDIPLYVRDLVRTKSEAVPMNRYNFLCEIPKWTRAKFEIATGEPFNPLKQDIKDGTLRVYRYGDMMWNYGALPQTWESTEVVFDGGYIGDNDPIDAIEIGMAQFKVGQVGAVKVLGILGMIDEGKMDWKVICISHNDPICRFLKDIHDVPKFLPGCLNAIHHWFRVYKICQGGTENEFMFNGEFMDKTYAMRIIDESHHMWGNLRKVNQKENV